MLASLAAARGRSVDDPLTRVADKYPRSAYYRSYRHKSSSVQAAFSNPAPGAFADNRDSVSTPKGRPSTDEQIQYDCCRRAQTARRADIGQTGGGEFSKSREIGNYRVDTARRWKTLRGRVHPNLLRQRTGAASIGRMSAGQEFVLERADLVMEKGRELIPDTGALGFDLRAQRMACRQAQPAQLLEL
jgi:hypothetical protein